MFLGGLCDGLFTVDEREMVSRNLSPSLSLLHFFSPVPNILYPSRHSSQSIPLCLYLWSRFGLVCCVCIPLCPGCSERSGCCVFLLWDLDGRVFFPFFCFKPNIDDPVYNILEMG